MIFVDSNIFVYAVGRAHPLREEAQGVTLEVESQDIAKCADSNHRPGHSVLKEKP